MTSESFGEVRDWVAQNIFQRYQLEVAGSIAAVTNEYVDDTTAFDVEPAEDYATAIIQCANNGMGISFVGAAESPFVENTTDGLFGRQVRIQLFVGLVSLYAQVYHGAADRNALGRALDNRPQQAARDLVAKSRTAEPEKEMIAELVRNYGLPAALNAPMQVDRIASLFLEIWSTVCNSIVRMEHTDEFFLALTDRGQRGKCVVHKGRICISFVSGPAPSTAAPSRPSRACARRAHGLPPPCTCSRLTFPGFPARGRRSSR